MVKFFHQILAITCSAFLCLSVVGQALNSPCIFSKAFQADMDTGHVKVYFAGAADYGNTFERLMMDRHNVEVVETNLFGLKPEMVCYNKFSVPYIKSQFGEDILEKTEREAHEMDKNGLGDSPPSLPTDIYDSIATFFHQRVDPQLYQQFLPQSHQGILSVYAIFYVDENGRFIDLHEPTVKSHPMDSVLVALTKQLPYRAEPALDDGSPGPGTIHSRLNFDESSIEVFEAFRRKQSTMPSE